MANPDSPVRPAPVRAGRGVAAAAGVVLGLLAAVAPALAAASQSAAAASTVVSLVPARAPAMEAVWNFAARHNPPCATALGLLRLEANPWNVRARAAGAACTGSAGGTTRGTVAWAYAKGALELTVALRDTDLDAPTSTVAAYPELIYGWSPFAAAASALSPTLALPLRLGRLPPLLLETRYAACAGCLRASDVDFAYDLWLTPAYRPFLCGACREPGTIEVMLWLAHSPGLAPAGSPDAGAAVRPALWQRRAGHWRRSALPFEAYLCAAGAPACPTHSVVSFVPAGLSEGLTRADLALPLSPFLAAALAALPAALAPLHPRALYLNGIELGSEVGPGRDGRVQNGGGVRFSLSLGRYCIVRVPARSGAAPPAAC